MPRVFLKAREPFSSYSHFVGAVLSGVGLFAMLIRMLNIDTANGQMAASVIIFCLSLIGLYSASSVYHYSCRDDKTLRRLKKLDHSMIYVLIAGSYTPIVLCYMRPPHNYMFLAFIWSIAAAGIVVKLVWIDAPRFLGTALYLALGWAIVLDFDVVLSMPAPAITLLAAGGIFYTIGGMIYIAKRPNPTALFGFHEIFHLFVIAGSVCHYLMVFLYVL